MEVGLLTGRPERTLETVRVLHETILTLRTALEGSQKELDDLRGRARFSSPGGGDTLHRRRHEGVGYRVTRRRVLCFEAMDDKSEDGQEKRFDGDLERCGQDKADSEDESDDIDDIELVFTTGETDPSSLHEDLVPIAEESTTGSFTKTVVVETDISKCGVIDERGDAIFSTRRNTLPNPLPYQPIVHREILAAARKAPMRSPCKALLPGTQDTSVQTDITALPSQWKSETYLAHKMNFNLTTLPSKFALPATQTKRLIPLSDKTCEARRVLLSDINFTSMVPELSRSADHLHDEKGVPKTPTSTYEGAAVTKASSRKTDRCCEYSRQESRSSCGSYYESRCHASSTSIHPFICEDVRRRHSWKPPHIFCCRSKHFFWSSVPSSPIKCVHGISETSVENVCHFQPNRRKGRIHYHCCDYCRQSMPNLRLEGDSGESTDSLMDEAEEFLRRSVDNMMISTSQLKKRERRLSDAESVSSFEPPKTAQPFLPKFAKDLIPGCFAKVITPQGKIAVGRVRYSGLVPGRTESYVGLELSSDAGFSDGTFMGHHFFDCEPSHAVFVPFKKVVIAWNV